MASDWIELTEVPLIAATASDFVTDVAAGGIAMFLGTTRSERTATGIALAALDYEAYAEMALAEMQRLAAEARARWPINKLALLHRTGRVAVGEPSVIIAVSTPHRAAAFEASRWLIDTLKVRVAVWKKEVWADGSMSWVDGAEVLPLAPVPGGEGGGEGEARPVEPVEGVERFEQTKNPSP